LSTVAWNVGEAVVAIAAGAIAGSVALISFGIDSSVEIISAMVVSWRLWREYRGRAAQDTDLLERQAARITGGLLLLLAVYIVVDAGRRLMGFGEEADASLAGIALTGLSLLVMPLLGWAKLRTAQALQSAAMRADAFETIACAWLSLTTLLGLALNAALGWSWADPLAAILITPLIVREGIEGWQSGNRSQAFRKSNREWSRR
jgi:divalent metal cation (Fe/Co/Zn/Cd) transporter